MDKHIKSKACREPMGWGKTKRPQLLLTSQATSRTTHLFWPSSVFGSSSVAATTHCWIKEGQEKSTTQAVGCVIHLKMASGRASACIELFGRRGLMWHTDEHFNLVCNLPWYILHSVIQFNLHRDYGITTGFFQKISRVRLHFVEKNYSKYYNDVSELHNKSFKMNGMQSRNEKYK